MGDKLAVQVVTPNRQVAESSVDMVLAPSVFGQIGILPNHAPLLAALGPGVVELQAARATDRFFVAGGFVEVERDRVVILAESAESVESIDREAAQVELTQIEGQLRSMDLNDPSYAMTLFRVERARSRLQAAPAK